MGTSSKKLMDHLTKRKRLKMSKGLHENQGRSSGKITEQYRTADQKNGRGGQRTRHQVTQKRFEEKIAVLDLSSFNHLIIRGKESEHKSKSIQKSSAVSYE